MGAQNARLMTRMVSLRREYRFFFQRRVAEDIYSVAGRRDATVFRRLTNGQIIRR